MLNEVVLASPRISTSDVTLGVVLTDRNRSSPDVVWIEKAPGVSGVGIIAKDSRGDTAVAFALRMPYLSALRYLEIVSNQIRAF